MTTEIFNSGTSTWIVPPTVTSVTIELWGGGGGGGAGENGAGSGEIGGGGGAGGYCSKVVAVTPGDSISYSVGSGGSGQSLDSDLDGGSGSSTTCSTFSLTAFGGSGGGSFSSGGGAEGLGGIATGGDTNTTGSDGTNSSSGGFGGASPNGGATQTAQGANGNAPGGGGASSDETPGDSGDGAAGRISFTYVPSGTTYNETGDGGCVSGGFGIAPFLEVATGGTIGGGTNTYTATIVVYPNADASIGNWVNESAGTTNLYASINEGTELPNDLDYISSSDSDDDIYFSLGDMPDDFLSATSVIVRMRLRRTGTKGDYLNFDSVQLIQNSGADLTSSSTISDSNTTATYSYAPTVTGPTNKSAWNASKIHISLDIASGGGSCVIYAVQVEIQYVVSTGIVSALSSGPLSPGTLTNDAGVGTDAWVNPSNAGSSNDTYAVYTDTDVLGSNYLKATNFGFTIPSGTTAIAGVKVEVECKANFDESGHSGRRIGSSIQMLKNGVLTGDIKESEKWSLSDEYFSDGDEYYFWGNTLTPADINDADFGFALKAGANFGGEEIGYVDHIRVTVYYDYEGANSIFNEIGSGGILVGSSANVKSVYYEIGVDGGLIGGEAEETTGVEFHYTPDGNITFITNDTINYKISTINYVVEEVGEYLDISGLAFYYQVSFDIARPPVFGSSIILSNTNNKNSNTRNAILKTYVPRKRSVYANATESSKRFLDKVGFDNWTPLNFDKDRRIAYVQIQNKARNLIISIDLI